MGKKEILLAIGLTIAGCKPNGLAAPNGKNYYIGGGEKIPKVVEHEECHQEKISEMGGHEFWKEYATSNEFRCEEEHRCGIPRHVFCEGDEGNPK